MKWILCELLAFSTLGVVGKEIRLLDVIIPQRKFVKSDALLQCIFDIKTPTELYSVTWYKDNNEFYRYLPRDIPQSRAFPLPGVKVDLEASDEQKVLLRNLEISSSGVYMCEISAEAPIFHTVSGQGTLKVYSEEVQHAEYATKPRISGLRGLYSMGDSVEANCTIPRPPTLHTRIEWFVNDKKAAPQWITDYDQQLKQEKINTMGLKLVASNLTFPDRILNMRCVAHFGSRKEQQHRWTFLVTRPHSSGDWGWQSTATVPVLASLCSVLALALAITLS